MDFDPCPHCGQEGFINARCNVGAQYVQSGQYQGEYDIDDMWFDSLEYASCGNCNTVLYDSE